MRRYETVGQVVDTAEELLAENKRPAGGVYNLAGGGDYYSQMGTIVLGVEDKESHRFGDLYCLLPLGKADLCFKPTRKTGNQLLIPRLIPGLSFRAIHGKGTVAIAGSNSPMPEMELDGSEGSMFCQKLNEAGEPQRYAIENSDLGSLFLVHVVSILSPTDPTGIRSPHIFPVPTGVPLFPGSGSPNSEAA